MASTTTVYSTTYGTGQAHHVSVIAQAETSSVGDGRRFTPVMDCIDVKSDATQEQRDVTINGVLDKLKPPKFMIDSPQGEIMDMVTYTTTNHIVESQAIKADGTNVTDPKYIIYKLEEELARFNSVGLQSDIVYIANGDGSGKLTAKERQFIPMQTHERRVEQLKVEGDKPYEYTFPQNARPYIKIVTVRDVDSHLHSMRIMVYWGTLVSYAQPSTTTTIYNGQVRETRSWKMFEKVLKVISTMVGALTSIAALMKTDGLCEYKGMGDLLMDPNHVMTPWQEAALRRINQKWGDPTTRSHMRRGAKSTSSKRQARKSIDSASVSQAQQGGKRSRSRSTSVQGRSRKRQPRQPGQ